jgi:hypothetical protein
MKKDRRQGVEKAVVGGKNLQFKQSSAEVNFF